MKKILNILMLILTFSVQGQISESWNLDIDSYTHSSTNYTTKTPPIEFAIFKNNDLVLLSQNGSLVKLKSNGEIIWKKKVDTCSQQRMIIDSNDHIIFSCGTQITKFDSNGKLIWNYDYKNTFNKKYLTFDAITTNDSNIYVVGHFFFSKFICQFNIDENGKVIWKTKFKQKVNYEFSFLPPKQIIVFNDIIFILAHHYTKSYSFLYSTNLNGKKRKEKRIEFKIKKLKTHNDELFILGHLDNLKDKLIFGKINEKLDLSNILELKLHRNIDYEKAILNWSRKPPTKEEFEKEYITAYDINDFEFTNSNNIVIVGNSYGKSWYLNWDLNKGINWNCEIVDDRYFKFNNKHTRHYYVLNTIKQINNKFLICGISIENDDRESRFTDYINLFIREVEFEK